MYTQQGVFPAVFRQYLDNRTANQWAAPLFTSLCVNRPNFHLVFVNTDFAGKKPRNSLLQNLPTTDDRDL